MFTRPAILLALVSACALFGCDAGSVCTADEVKRDYASRFVEGIDFGLSGSIKAASYDAVSLTLHDVRIEDGIDHLYHADTADILIDTDKNTIALELVGVTGADAELGGLFQTSTVTTSPVRLSFDVVP